MKKKSESNNQKFLYVISKIVLCFAIVLLSLVFCNTRAEALEQISFSKVAKITAPAQIKPLVDAGKARVFSYTKEPATEKTVLDYSISIPEAGLFGLQHVNNGWASNVVAMSLYRDKDKKELVERHSVGNKWYLKKGTYYFSVYYAARIKPVTHYWCAFFMPDSKVGAKTTQKLSADKKSCTITISAEDMEHASFEIKQGYAEDIVQWKKHIGEPNVIKQDSKNSFTVTKNGDYTILVKWWKIYEYGKEWNNVIHIKVTGIGGKTASTSTVPTNVKATLLAYNRVKLTWSRASGAKSYNIYRKTGNGKYKKIKKNVTVTSYTESFIATGKKYIYYIKPVNSKGKEGKSSKSASVSTIGTVTGVSVKRMNNYSLLRASWKAAVGASDYQVSASTSKTKTESKGTVISSRLNKDISAELGKTWYIKVRAYQKVDGKNIYGKWSSIKSYDYQWINPYTKRTTGNSFYYSPKQIAINEKKDPASGTYADYFFCKGVADYIPLIKISALAAASTYGGSTASLLEQCGFSILKSNGYYTGLKPRGKLEPVSEGTLLNNDHCTVYTGSKYVSFNDGNGSNQDKRIIAVVINGYSGDAYEWMSNFNMSTGGIHQGFKDAADEVYSYLKEQYGSLDNSIIWITGHSRGAAITNLVAETIIKNYKNPDSTEVFAYGFATPNTEKTVISTDRVINVVNSGDFVPYLPLGAWGFRKVGVKQYTFSVNSKIQSQYSYLTGDDLNSMTGSERANLINIFNSCCNNSQSGYYKHIGIEQTCAYDFMSKGLANLMNHRLSVKTEGLQQMTLYARLSYKYKNLMAFLVVKESLNSKIFGAHAMETYLSYTNTLS